MIMLHTDRFLRVTLPLCLIFAMLFSMVGCAPASDTPTGTNSGVTDPVPTESSVPTQSSPTTEPSEPSTPSVPTEPSEPSTPSAPTEPTEPSNPSVPTEPSEPSTPSVPTEPSEPSTPSVPTEPSEPSTPSVPTEPSEPSTPSVPTEPSEPSTPSEPTQDDVLASQPPKSLKILAIGNSFSTDSMEYLFQIAKNAGVEEIVLGNLSYSGCSLDQHYSFAKADSGSYTYYKNTAGSWRSTKNYKLSDAVKDEQWDFISLQQTSKTCGLPASYSKLDGLVSIVRSYNSSAKLVWNMTWAYQQDSTHSSFPNYNSNQMTMYNMIISTTLECISPDIFSLVIPCGTSIQNARTSFMGDTLTRDGYHLDMQIGRYIAGLTWFAALTNCSVANITYNPSPTLITEEMMLAAKDAVEDSIREPYAVTQSTHTTGSRPGSKPTTDPSTMLDPADFIEADTSLATSYGVDLTQYTQLKWDYLENAYWYCTSKPGLSKPSSTASTYQQNVCSDRKYSISELPVGTIFILDSGWQYRLEIYVEENAKYTGARPGLSTQPFFVLTEDFLNGCNYIAWNISSSPKTDISAIYQQAACHLRIYIPNTDSPA